MKRKTEQRAQPAALAYSIAQLSAASNLSRATIYEHIQDGRLKTIKVGRRRLVLPDAARTWLQGFEQ